MITPMNPGFISEPAAFDIAADQEIRRRRLIASRTLEQEAAFAWPRCFTPLPGAGSSPGPSGAKR